MLNLSNSMKFKAYHPQKQRYKFCPTHIKKLNEAFAVNPTPSKHCKEQLAHELGIPLQKVQVWFNNRKRSSRPPLSGATSASVSEAESIPASPELKPNFHSNEEMTPSGPRLGSIAHLLLPSPTTTATSFTSTISSEPPSSPSNNYQMQLPPIRSLFPLETHHLPTLSPQQHQSYPPSSYWLY